MGPPIVYGAQVAAQTTKAGAYHAATAATSVAQSPATPAAKRYHSWGIALASDALSAASLRKSA